VTQGDRRTVISLLSRSFTAANRRGWTRQLVLVPFYLLRFAWRALRSGSGAFARYYPGYHGSTLPGLREVMADRERIFRATLPCNDGVELHEDAQLALLERFIGYFPDFRPAPGPTPDRLYHLDNDMFGFNDAFVLYAMLREVQPARVVEVGSGYSSALMLDTARERGLATRFTFIDPYSTNIAKVLAGNPQGAWKLVRTPVQDAGLELYRELEAGDILFIDTSHVVKIGSDLSFLFFHVLPSLRPGVLVHIHDIWHPWEYPEAMVREGRAYNEIYFVRAFLQFNRAFEVVYFSSFVEHRHRALIQARMPGYFNAGSTGASLWLRRTA
jgi:predicted O-methyltransferase YrrM